VDECKPLPRGRGMRVLGCRRSQRWRRLEGRLDVLGHQAHSGGGGGNGDSDSDTGGVGNVRGSGGGHGRELWLRFFRGGGGTKAKGAE
jgi:hypothetical protein